MVSVARLVSARSPSAAALLGAPAWRARLLLAGDLRICWLPSGSSSSLPAGGEVGLHAVELRGRIWRLELRAGRASLLLPALGMKTDAARRWCWRGRVLAVHVHRLKFRCLRRTGSAAIYKVGGALRPWLDGGRRSSSSTPALLLVLLLALFPCVGLLFFVFVLHLCM